MHFYLQACKRVIIGNWKRSRNYFFYEDGKSGGAENGEMIMKVKKKNFEK